MNPDDKREKERQRKAKWRKNRHADQIQKDREMAKLGMQRHRNEQLIKDIVNDIVQSIIKK